MSLMSFERYSTNPRFLEDVDLTLRNARPGGG